MPLEVVALDDPNGRDICELRFVLVRPTVTLRGVATRCPTTQPRSSIRCAALRSRRNE
jgi:hypothetical protein